MSAAATVIVPQHGRSDLTLACVRSFREAHGDGAPIIMIDDGSDSGEIEKLAAAAPPNVQLMRLERCGVTAAWNAGANATTSEFLVFLNNDVATTGPWLVELIAPLRSEGTVICGVERRMEQALPEAILRRLPTREFAAGWCFAVRRDDFDAVGGFEPSLRLYFSDTDLQARLLARVGRGREAIAVFGSRSLTHIGHATASRLRGRRDQWRADRARFVALWRRSRTEFSQQAVLVPKLCWGSKLTG